MIGYRSFVVLVMRILRRRNPTWTRRHAYREADELTALVWELTMPFRTPRCWLRGEYIRWQVRRGTWGIRV